MRSIGELQRIIVMNGSIPLHASLAYATAAPEDPFDFDLFAVLARESPPSLASAEQVPPPRPNPRPPHSDLPALDGDGTESLSISRTCLLKIRAKHQSSAHHLLCWPPTQDSSPSASGQPGSGGQQDAWGVPCTTFHNYAAQLEGLANDLWELTPPVAQPGMRLCYNPIASL